MFAVNLAAVNGRYLIKNGRSFRIYRNVQAYLNLGQGGVFKCHVCRYFTKKGAALLPGPFSNIIGLALSDNSDMHQFITDVSEYIDVKHQQPKVYNQLIMNLFYM